MTIRKESIASAVFAQAQEDPAAHLAGQLKEFHAEIEADLDALRQGDPNTQFELVEFDASAPQVKLNMRAPSATQNWFGVCPTLSKDHAGMAQIFRSDGESGGALSCPNEGHVTIDEARAHLTAFIVRHISAEAKMRAAQKPQP